MEQEIYIIQRSAFSVFKTNNPDLTKLERERDYKNSYPINIPIPSKGQIRIDGLSKDRYFYGLDTGIHEDELIALIFIGHEGIEKIINLKNGHII